MTPTWKQTRVPDGHQFDLVLPNDLSPDDVAAIARDQRHQIQAGHINASPRTDWVSLANQLPKELREVLLVELERANPVVGIGQTGWPSPGSIVVTMRDRFAVQTHALPPAVTWTVLNDPRQWREDMIQVVDGVEHLLIT